MAADEVESLIESKPLAQQMAADPGMKPGPANGEIGKGRNSSDNVIANKGHGNSAEYLVRRLKRDAPEIAADLAKGRYPSARAAAKAAGFVKDKTRLEWLRLHWKKASKEQKDAFMDEVGKAGR